MKLTNNETKLDDHPLNLEFFREYLREKLCLIYGGNEREMKEMRNERRFFQLFGYGFVGEMCRKYHEVTRSGGE